MGDSKTKLPKHIAGVKLPKKLRRKANKALRALDQPIVRNLAQVALAAASAAAAKHADEARTAAESATKKTKGAKPAEAAAPAPGPSHSQMADVAAGLALAAITKWLSAKQKPADEVVKPASEALTTH